jgi:hypothetical protein
LARAGERVLVLQPTKELINKTVQDELPLFGRPPRHHVFHGGTDEGRVASAITNHFNAADDGGQIVFATHASLSHVPFWANKRDWHVLVDEEIQVLQHSTHQLPKTHSIITDHLELEAYNSIYGRVAVRDLAELREKGRNRDEDEILGQVAGITRTLTNSHWNSFVNMEQYERLKSGGSKHLSIHSVLNPSILEGFGSVFIAGANFEDSPQYRLWSDKGVGFVEDSHLPVNENRTTARSIGYFANIGKATPTLKRSHCAHVVITSARCCSSPTH